MVRHHKFGIWWLFLLASNSFFLGVDVTNDRPWHALVAGFFAALCAVLAYFTLTHHDDPRTAPMVITRHRQGWTKP